MVYTVGQICPKVEVPPPNSKEAKSFPARRLSAYIKRAFMKRGFVVKSADISRVFPQYTEGSIRNRLKEVAEYIRGANKPDGVKKSDTGQWELRSDVEITAKDIEAEFTPEDMCVYELLNATVQRLKDMG